MGEKTVLDYQQKRRIALALIAQVRSNLNAEIKSSGNFWYKNCMKCDKFVQGSAKRRACLLSYSQAEPGRELTQPSPRLLAEPCGSGEFASGILGRSVMQAQMQLQCSLQVMHYSGASHCNSWLISC